MKNLYIFGVHGKIRVLRGWGGLGRGHKKPIYRGDGLKRGLGQFPDLKGGDLIRRRGVVFFRGRGC